MSESPPERYRSHRLISRPVGRDFALVYPPEDSDASELLPARVVEILGHCAELRSLDEHAASFSLARGFSDGQRAATREILGSLAESGLLYSEADLFELCRDAGDGAGGARIRTLAVVTCDRVESLLRCVGSYAENTRRFGREVRFVVADDTREAAQRGECRRRLAAFAVKSGVALSYAGREEKESFAERLAALSGVDLPVVDFALFGAGRRDRVLPPTFGGNRNAVLLATAGQPVLSLDDDTVCRTALSPEANDGIGGTALAWRYRYYEDRRAAVEAAHFVDLDLLAAHERLLGRTTGACVADAARRGRLEADAIDGQLAAHLLRGGGPVVLTLCGSVGDHGSERPTGVLHLRGASRQRLLDSRASYRAACRGRDAVKLVETPTLIRPGYCMAYNLGLDGRHLLPPFFPVGRNEDPLFAFTLAAVADTAYAGVTPLAVLHDPAPRPAFADDAVWRAVAKTRICDVVCSVVQAWDALPVPKKSDDRLPRLGAFLADVASLGDTEHKAFLRDVLWAQVRGSIASLESSLDETPEAPGFWRDDVRRQIDTLYDTAVTDGFEVPADLGVASPGEARVRCRDMLRRFGELLSCWPALVAAARELSETGRGMASPL